MAEADPAKIAAKQHAELVNTLDLIEVRPPGLYEMILEEKEAEDVGADLHVTGSMWCRARGSEKRSCRRQRQSVRSWTVPSTARAW